MKIRSRILDEALEAARKSITIDEYTEMVIEGMRKAGLPE